jgi:ABC-2 type transport system permease protein
VSASQVASILWSETRLQVKLFLRSPVGAFFTLVFPLMILVLFSYLNAGNTIESLGGISFAQFFTPGLAVFGMVTATFTNLAIVTADARQSGILKRVLATPVPMSAHLAGRILAAVGAGVASVSVMLGAGVVLFGVEIPWAEMPSVMLMMTVGAATFSALGLAVAAISPDARSAPALANATILPLAFVSGIFFPLAAAPLWLQTLAGLFPLEPFATAVIDLFNSTTANPFPWSALLVMALWLAVGTAMATRYLSWEPRAAQGLRRPG